MYHLFSNDELNVSSLTQKAKALSQEKPVLLKYGNPDLVYIKRKGFLSSSFLEVQSPGGHIICNISGARD